MSKEGFDIVVSLAGRDAVLDRCYSREESSTIRYGCLLEGTLLSGAGRLQAL